MQDYNYRVITAGLETQLRQLLSPWRGVPAGCNALAVSASQGVTSSNSDQYRDRTTVVEVTAAEAEGLRLAWFDYGTRAALDWINRHWDDNYHSNWEFLSIEKLEWTGR